MRAYERLLKYVTFNTAGKEDAAGTPSTPGQHTFAAYLAEEMRAIGLSEAFADEHAYAYGHLPATPGYEDKTPIGFLAHIDTVAVPEGGVVRPRLVEQYDGGELALGDSGLVLSPENFPHLARLQGETLIVTDGTTILGADDKAGVAEIMTAMERLIREEIPHGPVSVCFPPDEEIGHGAELMDISRFGAKYAYTLDGSDIDELAYETFNAAAARVTIRGVEVHPGSAKDVMVNASVVAAEFISMLPREESPEHTEGYEGFYHLTEMEGDVGHASLSFILRDHNREKLEARRQRMRDICCELNERYGGGTAELSMRDQYYNLADALRDCPEVLDKARSALESLGITPVSKPMRGGTDGAQLAYRGLPCPNIGTGGFGFHGPFEHITVERMDKMTDVVLAIVGQYAK